MRGKEKTMEMQVVKVRYKSRDGGWQDREWLYFAPAEIKTGDIVRLKTRWGEASAIVSSAGEIQPAEIAPEILEKMQMIIGKEKEEDGTDII